MILVKISEFYQISLKNLPCLTVFSLQLMACMCHRRNAYFLIQLLRLFFIMQVKLLYPNKMKTVFSEENYVPPTHQLVQEIECRQGSFFTVFIVW